MMTQTSVGLSFNRASTEISPLPIENPLRGHLTPTSHQQETVSYFQRIQKNFCICLYSIVGNNHAWFYLISYGRFMKINDFISQAHIPQPVSVFLHVNLISSAPLGRQCHLKYSPSTFEHSVCSIQTEDFCVPCLILLIEITRQFSCYLYPTIQVLTYCAVPLNFESRQFVNKKNKN